MTFTHICHCLKLLSLQTLYKSTKIACVADFFQTLIKDRLLKRVLNLSRGLSVVSNTFEQCINLGYDLVLVLITGP